jgi:hypothetical protein
MPTFVRSFAYLSGPAYGLLLDAASPGWQTKAKSGDDLGDLLRTALALNLPEAESGDLAARTRRYDGDKLRDQEEKRDRERQNRIADLRARFVDGPVLTIPLQKLQISFDPNASQPLEGVGTLYMSARIGDKWGTLTAPRGVLISADFTKASVPAPSDPQTKPLKGDGWELQLADSWRLDAGQRKGDWQVVSATTPRITATEADHEIVASLKPHLDAGKKAVERFFDRPFPKTFDVEVLPSRSSFDEYFHRRWKIPKTEAWMVASGVADRMVILSPRVWNAEAREHNPANTDHVRDLIAHELVHVYHGQFCPKPDFDGMDDMGWFVEGLAVLVSGQLEHSHRSAAADALKAGKAPARLADAWSGRYRYGVSGSMVEFVDKRFGRDVIRKLLTAQTNEEALKILNTTEAQFLENWKADVAARR